MKKFGAMMLAAVVGSAITIGSYQWIGSDNETVKIEHVDGTPTVQARYNTNNEGSVAPFDFTGAAERVMPAVVHIRSTQTSPVASQQRQVPEEFRDFFGPFLRGDQGQSGPRVGSGSGVIISDKGYIVTNNHVIDQADDIDVTLNDNRSYKAKVIGTDPTTDLALLQIREQQLDYLPLVNSDNVKVGEWVLAVGNPFNLNSTVTAGIVSAKGRSIGIIGERGNGKTDNSIESFIQTDAAVNPGNSGGALVNLNGDLIGINTAIASPTGSYSGYSFAVPSNIVNRVIEDLITYGTVQRGLLGATISNVNSEFAKENELDVNAGAYVNSISENSGAEEAGVKTGDVIVAVDQMKIRKTSQLIGYLGSKRPGDKVTIKVNRKGEELNFDVVLKNSVGNTDIIKEKTVEAVLGAEFEEISEKVKQKLDITSGVMVKKLNSGRLKRQTKMRGGFIITKIDGKNIKSVEDVTRALQNKEGGVLIQGVYEDTPGLKYYGLGMD